MRPIGLTKMLAVPLGAGVDPLVVVIVTTPNNLADGMSAKFVTPLVVVTCIP